MNHLNQLVFAIVVFACQSTIAGGLFRSVPQDGDWVEFETVNHLFGPDARESTVRRVWISRTCGIEQRDGKRCQWIEVEETNLAKLREKSTWNRYLIPTARLAQGIATPADVIEHRKRSGNGPLAINPGPISEKTFRMYFPGALISTVEERKRCITYNGGTLQCAKCIRQSFQRVDGADETQIDYTLWPHDGVPFGVAAATIELRRSRNGRLRFTWHREFKLCDFRHRKPVDSSSKHIPLVKPSSDRVQFIKP